MYNSDNKADYAAILAQPHALVNHQLRATGTHDSAILCDWIRGWFDEVWHTAKSDTAAARPARDTFGRTDPDDVMRCDIVALRGAMEVKEIYEALTGLPSEQRHALANSIQGQNRIDLVNATLATIPAGAVWLARKAARDESINTANAQAAARREAHFKCPA